MNVPAPQNTSTIGPAPQAAPFAAAISGLQPAQPLKKVEPKAVASNSAKVERPWQPLREPGSPKPEIVKEPGISLETVQVSEQAQLLATLRALGDEDPQQFRQVVRSMARKIRTKAQSEGGDAAKELEHIAQKLEQVAKTRDVSHVAPKGRQATIPWGIAAYHAQQKWFEATHGSGLAAHHAVIEAFTNADTSGAENDVEAAAEEATPEALAA